MTRTERVENLVKNFMQYHNDGHSIIEIAKIFEVDLSTVYNHLQEIADANNVSRESLLERKSSKGFSRLPFYKEKVDAEKLKDDFKKVEEDLDKVIEEIDNILTTEE